MTMTTESPFAAAGAYRPAELHDDRGIRVAAVFTSAADEYRAAREGLVVFERSTRRLLAITGRDRATWLHNLVTNAIKPLTPGTGCYTFAIDVRGRVVFDANILCLEAGLLLDVDHHSLSGARAHLDRYHFSEDVNLEPDDANARLACAGPRAAQAAARCGVGGFDALMPLASVAVAPLPSPSPPSAGERDLRVAAEASPASVRASLANADTPRSIASAPRFVRHDLTGLPGFELIVPREAAAAWWDVLVRDAGATPAGFHAIDALRIQAAIPWSGRDIDDKVIPPETGQGTRGVSYNKGCYLGQEVLERMRSHGTLARRLVRLRIADGAGLALPTPLRRGAAEVGRVTSLVRHPVDHDWIGLGYVRTSVVQLDELTAGAPPRAVRIVPE
ncbi:MAG: folate-binding protein YgfZ [Phycisphaerae bacterium]